MDLDECRGWRIGLQLLIPRQKLGDLVDRFKILNILKLPFAFSRDHAQRAFNVVDSFVRFLWRRRVRAARSTMSRGVVCDPRVGEVCAGNSDR